MLSHLLSLLVPHESEADYLAAGTSASCQQHFALSPPFTSLPVCLPRRRIEYKELIELVF
jgi:hypothetical protein